MVGTNKLELNDETLAEAVQKHLNEHVFMENVRVVKVAREYIEQRHAWIAYLEPPKVEGTTNVT